MNQKKQKTWLFHTMAIIGITIAMTLAYKFGLWPVTVLIGIFAIPATVWNIVSDTKAKKLI